MDKTRRFAGQTRVRDPPESERPHRIEHGTGTKTLTDDGHDDVAGLDHRLLTGEAIVTVGIAQATPLWRDVKAAVGIEDLPGMGHARFDGRRPDKGLKDRSRLEGVGDAPVAAAAGYSESQNPMTQCIFGLPPGNMGGPNLHEVEILDDVILLHLEYNEVTRTVFMDGREHPADLTPSNQGHSIGWWEDDTLVVDTIGLAEHPWGNGRGIPSSPQRHSVERLTLSEDGRNVQIEYMFEDAEYLTEAVTNSISWAHAPDMQMLPNTCDPEVASRILD